MTISNKAVTSLIIILVLFVFLSTIFPSSNKNNSIRTPLRKGNPTTRSEELSLYTFSEVPTSFPVFTDISLQPRSVRFLAHSFKGQYIDVPNDFFGFSFPISNAKGHLEPSLRGYVIVPSANFNLDLTKEALNFKLQSLLNTTTQSNLHLLFPTFNTSLYFMGSNLAIHFNITSLSKTSMQLPSLNVFSMIQVVVNRPFYLYLMETNTNTILADASLTHLGTLILNQPLKASNDVPAPLNHSSTSSTDSSATLTKPSASFIDSSKEKEKDQAEFHPIQYLARQLSEKPIPIATSLSPLGVSYSFFSVLPFIDTSKSIGKELFNYIISEWLKPPTTAISIHQLTHTFTPHRDDYGYFFYSPTFDVSTQPNDPALPLPLFNEHVLEHGTDFDQLLNVTVGHHGLPFHFVHFYPLDPMAHTLVHYFNLDEWYWSTPFLRDTVRVHYWGLRQSMSTLARTAFVENRHVHLKERYKAFQLQLQTTPFINPYSQGEIDKGSSNQPETQKKLSVYIIFNYFDQDDHDTIPFLTHEQFTRIRLDLLRTSPQDYRIRIAMFQPQLYIHLFTNDQLPRLFALSEKGFPNLEPNEIVDMTLEQTINLCITEQGIGISSDSSDLNSRIHSKQNEKNKEMKEIQVFSPFYFVLFDESTQSMISATLITRKDFAEHPVECV